jgi:hypothetical protein
MDISFNELTPNDSKVPSARSQPLLVHNTLDNTLILLGGIPGTNQLYLHNMYSFDLYQNTWSLVQGITTESTTSFHLLEVPRWGVAGVYHAPTHSLYIFGGIDEDMTEIYGDFYQYKITEKKWCSITADQSSLHCPGSRYCPSMNQWKLNKLIVFGGMERFDETSNDVWMYDTVKDTWTCLCQHSLENTPAPRNNHCAVILNDKLYIHGGWDGYHVFNDLFCFDILQRMWTRIEYTEDPPFPRPLFAFTMELIIRNDWHQDAKSPSLIVFGGRDNRSRYNDMVRYDFNSQQWSLQTLDFDTSVRGGHKILTTYDPVKYEHHILVFGGKDGNDTFRADLIDFTISDHDPFLIRDVNHLYRESIDANIKINVQNKSYMVHDFIVSQSSYIRNKLQGNSITFADVPSHLFDYVLLLLYGNEIHYHTIFKENQFIDLILLLESMELKLLAQWCTLQFKIFLNMDSVQKFLKEAAMKHCQHIKIACKEFIAEYQHDTSSPTTASDPRTCLRDHLSSILKDHSYTDMELITEENQAHFKVHRALLNRCPYFSALFRSYFLESNKSTLVLPPVVDSDAFKYVLEYTYTDKFGSEISDDILMRVYHTAHFLEYTSCMCYCLFLGSRGITKENVLSRLSMCKDISLEGNLGDAIRELKKQCHSVLLSCDKVELISCIEKLVLSE